MKYLRTILYCAAIALTLATAPRVRSAAPPPTPLRVGDNVAAQFVSGLWKLATIQAESGGRYTVTYSDGTNSTLALSSLIRIQPGTTFATGDHVLALWKSGRMFPGTLTAQTGKVGTVKWDDGDTPLDVPLDQMVPFPSAQPGGSSKPLPSHPRSPVNTAPKAPLAIGDHVMAMWKGLRMYPGTITALTGQTATIKWDDGDTPLDVPLGQVTPFTGTEPAGTLTQPARLGTRSPRLFPSSARTVPPYSGPALTAGTSVAAFWKGISWYLATIDRVQADGSYFVKYADGDSGPVAKANVFPINETQALPTGTRVLAAIHGPRMSLGTVSGRKDERYLIQEDNQLTTAEVERTALAPISTPTAPTSSPAAPLPAAPRR